MIPECGRIGCTAPGVVTTVVQGARSVYELHHCHEHPDGAKIAWALGFDVLQVRALVA